MKNENKEFKTGDLVKYYGFRKSLYNHTGVVIGMSYGQVVVKFKNFAGGNDAAVFYEENGIKYDINNNSHLYCWGNEIKKIKEKNYDTDTC